MISALSPSLSLASRLAPTLRDVRGSSPISFLLPPPGFRVTFVTDGLRVKKSSTSSSATCRRFGATTTTSTVTTAFPFPFNADVETADDDEAMAGLGREVVDKGVVRIARLALGAVTGFFTTVVGGLAV